METIRAFIAVQIDEAHKERLSELISYLKKSNASVKWVNENQMHLTLKFLGNIEKEATREISGALKSIADNFKSFGIEFSEIGGFPNLARPRVIWIGIDKGKLSLKALNAEIEANLEKLGIKKESRDYKAHFTLGRVKALKNMQGLLKLIDESPFQMQHEIRIDKIILFQSTLTPQGAIYTPLAEHMLQLE